MAKNMKLQNIKGLRDATSFKPFAPMNSTAPRLTQRKALATFRKLIQ
jgi:hypothetical protein